MFKKTIFFRKNEFVFKINKMRIIVTNNGIQEISTINPLLNNPLIQNSKYIIGHDKSNLSHSYSTPSFLSQSSKKNLSNNISSSFSTNESSIIKPKMITIKQTKVQVPQEKSALYDKDNTINTTIVKQLPDIYYSLSSNSSNSLPILKQKYSLREIINEKCYEKLKEKIKKDQYIKNHDIIVDHTSFRKYMTDQKIFEDIEKHKKKKIDVNNSNLVEYLMGKTTITDKLLANINSYNEKRMNKINKICQKILAKNEQEKLFQQEVKQIMKNKEIKEREQTRLKMIQMNNDISSFYKKISAKYNYGGVSKKDNFLIIHKDFVDKYWKKNNNFKRFFHRRQSQSVDYSKY